MKNFAALAPKAMSMPGFVSHFDTTLSTQSRTGAAVGVRLEPAPAAHISRAGHEPVFYQHLPK